MRLTRRACALVRSAMEKSLAWARWVWVRVCHEPGYIDSLADLVICGVDLLTPALHVRVLGAQVVRVVAATVKGIVASLRPSQVGPHAFNLGFDSPLGFES